MQSFNDKWFKHLKEKNLFHSIHNNQAYKEYYRTKGLSAWNFEIRPVEERCINQYFTLYRFPDGSCLKVSSKRNKIDRNSMRYYPSEKGLCFAERMLFGCTNRMPWED